MLGGKVLRSSDCKHLAKPVKQEKPANKKSVKKLSKLGSLALTSVIVFAAVIIPSVTMLQNVEAVTDKKNSAFSIGDSDVFANVIADSDKEEKAEKTEKTVKTAQKAKKEEPKEKATEAATTAATTATTAATTAAPTEAPTTVYVARSSGLVSTTVVDTSYAPQYVSLSAYDRAKVERLVMGEAGSLGYNGAALVAQAIRDSMAVSGTSSVDYIINNYQYDAPTTKEPSAAVKQAVSYIFDNNGYAVQHRILYFYASNVVSNAWHESQQFIVSYGNVRFFDAW